MTQIEYESVRKHLRDLSSQLQAIHRLLAESERNETAKARFAEARGSTAPKCPLCKTSAGMTQHPASMNWTCNDCRVTWESSYLSGWNDGVVAKL